MCNRVFFLLLLLYFSYSFIDITSLRITFPFPMTTFHEVCHYVCLNLSHEYVRFLLPSFTLCTSSRSFLYFSLNSYSSASLTTFMFFLVLYLSLPLFLLFQCAILFLSLFRFSVVALTIYIFKCFMNIVHIIGTFLT